MIFTLSKIFSGWILPPGIFVLILFFAAWQARRFKVLFALSGGVLWLFSAPVFSSYLMSTLEEPFYHSAAVLQPVDGVVVLGGGRVQGAPNLPLSLESFKRLSWGAVQANSYHAPLIFSGGAYVGMSESEAAKITAKDMGKVLQVGNKSLREYGIIDESKSLDTRGNIEGIKSYFLSQGKQNPTLIVVTSAYHMKRAMMICAQAKLQVYPCATDFKVDNAPMTWLGFLPSIGALGDSYRAMHEYAGMASLLVLPYR